MIWWGEGRKLSSGTRCCGSEAKEISTRAQRVERKEICLSASRPFHRSGMERKTSACCGRDDGLGSWRGKRGRAEARPYTYKLRQKRSRCSCPYTSGEGREVPPLRADLASALRSGWRVGELAGEEGTAVEMTGWGAGGGRGDALKRAPTQAKGREVPPLRADLASALRSG